MNHLEVGCTHLSAPLGLIVEIFKPISDDLAELRSIPFKGEGMIPSWMKVMVKVTVLC